MRRYNYIFDGTLKAGHDFTYKYDPKDPFRLLSVDAKEYRSSTEEVDTTRREHSYAFDGNGNLVLQLSDLAERIDSASFADTAAMQVRQYLWDEDNRMLAANVNGFVSNYFYDAAGERTVKISAPDLAVYVNGAEALKNDSALVKFVGYVSPYLVVSNGGRYTKHIYAGTQRIASKLGDIEAFGADPRRVEYAGANLKEVDFGSKYEQQTKALLARYDSLGVMNKPRELNDYVGGQSFCCGEKEFEPSQTGKDEFETSDYEHLIFFYHPDHLGSTALVTDNDGNVVQSVAYIPYGEVFIEERNGTWNTPYLFNGKELDEETGLYYYGARYLNPTSGMWLSVDPLFEKYVGMSPYQYCNLNPLRFVDPTGMAGHEVNIETGDITWIDDLTEDNVAEGFMYVPAGEMLNEVVVYPKSMKGNTQNDDASAKNALASFGGTMATVVGNITNGIDGTANPMKDQGGSVGLTSKSRSFNYYKPQERYKGNGFYGNQYVKTYQLKHLGSVAKRVGGVGTAISTTANLFDGVYKDTNGFTEFNFGENTQRAAVKSVGSWAGAALGAKYCALICTPICPPWGTIVGGFVGGVVGGFGGEWLFENGYDLIR